MDSKNSLQVLGNLAKDEENTLKTIVRHVTAGGTLPTLCEVWGVRYCDVVAWLQEEKFRYEFYSGALHARAEWAKEEIYSELRNISKMRVVDFFDDDGRVRNPSEWSEEMKGLVKELKFDDDGEIREIKFWNKEKALEMLGKNLDMFKENLSVSGTLTLEELITVSKEGE